ncbi:hypothetical protein VCR20J5_210034 [Vibrio crassostreae]|nr:hypothetical protein VCR20J5_210034 [Vibrio crassostreae]CDT61908.1 hypothetical protein VCR15J5_730180 [Vibrio crassostreae]
MSQLKQQSDLANANVYWIGFDELPRNRAKPPQEHRHQEWVVRSETTQYQTSIAGLLP